MSSETKPGPTADRIAELKEGIETLEAVDGLSVLSEQAQANVTHTLAKLRAELSRLRNEQPKGMTL